MNQVNMETRSDLINRLKRIEGQVKGIQRMLEEGKDCGDVIIQISAIRAAINKVGSMMLEKQVTDCIEDAITTSDKEHAINRLSLTMKSFVKFSE